MPELAQTDAATRFEVPQIMDWTILPASITAAAWSDPEIHARLISDPTGLLRERIVRWPTDKTFCVVQDTRGVKYFALPARKEALEGRSRGELLQILAEETGNDDTLESWLPPDVIADALLDSEFRRELFRDAAAVLRDRGYAPPAPRVVVLENTERTYHLVLPQNPSRQEDLDFAALDSMLREKYGVNSTKCCASGTCD